MNWVEANDGLTDLSILSMIANGNNIFAGTTRGLFVSSDTGNSWIETDNGITASSIYSLAINDSNIFAGTDQGIFLSNNYGINWIPVNSGLTVSSFVASIAISGNNVFAITFSDSVYLSANNGNSWLPVNVGLPQYAYATTMISTDSEIFMGTNGVGIFISTNNGSNWQSAGLMGVYIASLAISDSTIFAGSLDAGIWQHSLSDITGIQQISPSVATFQLYPNPTSSAFTIETTGTGSQQLQVFDITGQLLLSQSITNNKTTIDASGLAVGVYLVSLKNSEGASTQKLVIAK